HDFFDRDLLVPAVAAVLLFSPGFGYFLGAAQRAPRLHDRLARHASIYRLNGEMTNQDPHHRATPAWRSIAGAYIRSTYSLTMRRAEKRGATERIDSFTIESQRRGTPAASRS